MEFQNPFALITPTLDGRVLNVLALADAAFTTGQLAKLLPFSDEGIRRVLKRLDRQGIVETRTLGTATGYQLNRQHLAADAVIQIARLQSTFIDRVESHLRTWVEPPVYAAVFGSMAQGSMKETSDIDVLVVREASTPFVVWDSQLAQLSQRITAWTGNDTRILDLTEQQIVSGEPVLEDVIEHGWTVFGSRRWLRRKMRGQE
ncbi:nucleotidyltransferase domain-containing protein [Nocardioides dilutus]